MPPCSSKAKYQVDLFYLDLALSPLDLAFCGCGFDLMSGSTGALYL
jgi:hypothetical protein